MTTASIKQTVHFELSPNKLYQLFLDKKAISTITQSDSTMNSKPSGEFDVFDGYCNGTNLELVEGERIMQEWHFSEDGWPEDHYSICTFDFEKEGTGTKLTFTQMGVPEQRVDAIGKGWKKHYWDPMKEFIKKKNL